MHTVLIVDDEYGIRELLSEILEDEGYQVLTAENAKIAQSLVGKHDFDLILLDIWMPDMDGISCLLYTSRCVEETGRGACCHPP